MNKVTRLAHIDALMVARAFLVKNLKYDDYKMDECRFVDQIYRINYIAKDIYERDVKVWVTIDLLYNTISADVELCQDELQNYL